MADEEFQYLDDEPVAQPRRSFGQRFRDSFGEAVQYGFAGTAARKVHDWMNTDKQKLKEMRPDLDDDALETLHDQIIAQSQKDLRTEAAARQAADPAWRPDESFLENIFSVDRWAPYLAGQVTGSAGPENLLMPGSSAAGRILGQGAISGGTDALYQGGDIIDEVEDEYKPMQTVAAAGVGSAFQGGVEGIGRLLSGARGARTEAEAQALLEHATPLEQDDLARVLNGRMSNDVEYGEPQFGGPIHPDDANTPRPTTPFERGEGMDERQLARYTKEQRALKEAQGQEEIPEGYYDGALHVNVSADEPRVRSVPILEDMSTRELADLEAQGVPVEQLLNDSNVVQMPGTLQVHPETGNHRSDVIGWFNDDPNLPPKMIDEVMGLPERPMTGDWHDRVAEIEAKYGYEAPPQDYGPGMEVFGPDGNPSEAFRLAMGEKINANDAEPQIRRLQPGEENPGDFDNMMPDRRGQEQQMQSEIPDEGAPPIEEVQAAPVEPVEDRDVVTRLTDALNNTTRLSAEQQKLYTQARSDKFKELGRARAKTSGEAGFRAELAALKGEYPKVEFEGVRDQFTPEDVDSLFNQIKENETLTWGEQVNARRGLAKLMDGALPQPAEVALLSRVFPPDFVQAAVKNRSTFSKLNSAGMQALGVPRSLMSSIDLSAPLRQGAFMIGRKEFHKALPTMFKEFYKGFKKDSGTEVLSEIRSRPTYDLMDRGGLAITDPHGHNVHAREEDFQSDWAEKIPGLGRGVRASSNAYAGFLNKLRADVFDSIAKKYDEAGVDLSNDPETLKRLTAYINAATGRGNLHKSIEGAAPMLNSLFFSPRLVSSRLTLMNPATYLKQDKIMRKEAIRDLLSFGTVAGTVLALAKAAGAEVEDDPRSSDFGKIKNGNTRHDILAGFGQYAVLAARLLSNEKKTLKGEVQEYGKGYKADTRLSALGDFARNKASPLAGYAATYLAGTDPTGEPYDAKDTTLKLFTPMFLGDLKEVTEEEGLGRGAAMAAPGFFGVGVSSFKPKQSAKDKKAELEGFQFLDEETPTAEGGDLKSNVEKDLGVRVTDSGTRTREEQEYLYRNFSGVAKPGTSAHEGGNAIDIAPRKGLTRKEVQDYFEEQGKTGVKIITRKHGSGPHWHVQWKGERDPELSDFQFIN